MRWFDYEIVVPFGNTNYDTALYASHDLDIGCPPNFPITALLSGKIASLTNPKWGRCVGIELDTKYNGKVPYCAHLHLSAINPTLQIGQHVNIGDLIGWCGGGTSEGMYNGTSNPTGVNFLNDTFNSSRIQSGFALMYGSEYGGIGWTNFPPIDWNLDPTQIIMNARKMSEVVDTSEQQFRDIWNSNTVGATIDTGIYKVLSHYMKTLNIGMPLSKEIHTVNWTNQPIIYQLFSSGYHVEYTSDKHTHIFNSDNKTVVTL